MRHILLFLSFLTITAFAAEKVVIVNSVPGNTRVEYGVERLKSSLQKQGYPVDVVVSKAKVSKPEWNISVVIDTTQSIGKEGYSIATVGKEISIKGNDASGVLYACIDLAAKINEKKVLPDNLNYSDKPEMVLRGACIGMQKPYYLPGRTVYEYPYTPETFPWFYDKSIWIKYLDMLVDNKMNSLYLWNGHPFASLVKLKDYPFAVEVSDETFKKNEEIYTFLTKEAEKRGIWVIQMFYNIIVSKPFAEHYAIKTQDRSRPITPLIADYTRKSIAAFIEKYPHVGLLVCLGEAMDTYDDDREWFTKTIIPGVKDGLKALGRTDEPPIILRNHDTDAKMVITASLPLYKNLYTMNKYNGESLTTYEPRGPWAETARGLSRLGSVFIENVHILANLEPFRYGSPDFIQKCVKAMHEVHGANAIHIYPQASYWDWPYSADKSDTRLLEMDRDWIWYAAWSRYAWKADRDRGDEINYWSARLDTMYNCGSDAAKNILDAYEQTGEISPQLLRKFGITEGNRQTFLLGMFMSQLVNPKKWTVYPDFYNSCGPEGELLAEYMNKEWNHQPHKGEVPPQMIATAVAHGEAAAKAIDSAAPHVTTNKAEFERLRNDVHCYDAFANFFAQKVKASMLVLEYGHSGHIADLDSAAVLIENSLGYYRHLVGLTKDTYLYANSMQTGQRKIPISSSGGKNKTWAELLPRFEEELFNFKKNIAFLKKNGGNAIRTIQPLKPAEVTLLDKTQSTFPLAKGEKVFGDQDYVINAVADELKQLKGIRFDMDKQAKEGTTVTFETKKPVNVLVGYFNTPKGDYARAPKLEVDASANDYGQADVKIFNAVEIPGRASINVHSYTFPAGKNKLTLGKGALMILGFTDASQKITPRNAGLGGEGDAGNVDWLFN